MFDHTTQRTVRLAIKYILMSLYLFAISYSIQNKCYNLFETSMIISGFSIFVFVILDKLFPEIIFIETNKNSFKQLNR
jgi:hypothetical protein